MSESSPQEKKIKPIIGISIGDFNGIGPEVIIKSVLDNRILKHVSLVLYCNAKIMAYYRRELDYKTFNYHQIKKIDQIHHRKFNVLNLPEQDIEVTPGKENEISGKHALNSLKAAIDDLKEGKIAALCTAPINKDLIQSEDFKFPGHTEFLASEAGVDDSLMLLVNEGLRVGVVTGHIPVKEIPNAMTKEKLRKKIKIFLKSLKKDFGKTKPRLAVLGLNPHAGENGLLGKEEQAIIAPVIAEFKKEGHLIFGPFPADGFFGNRQYQNFDGILAMYHDQGLIPFKNIAFETGVNFTAGLPFIRTSPDHGTAYPIAGKNQADPSSFRNALFLAADIANTRQEG